jgi:hypothetical protein
VLLFDSDWQYRGRTNFQILFKLKQVPQRYIRFFLHYKMFVPSESFLKDKTLRSLIIGSLPFQFIQIKSICQCVLQHPKSFLLLFFDIVSNFSNLQYISYSFTQSYSFHSAHKSNLFHQNPLLISGSKGLVNNALCVILIGPSSLYVDKLPLQYTDDFVNQCYLDKRYSLLSALHCSKHLSETINCGPSLHTFHFQNQFFNEIRIP